MQIISLKENKKINDSIVILGNFDGIHKGHNLLIEKAKELKETIGGNIVFFTFYPHPLEIITGKKFQNLIFSREEKIYTARELGIDIYFEYDFDKASSSLNAFEFIRLILRDRLGAKAIVVGEDFSFGHRHEGNVEALEILQLECLYELYPMKKLEMNGEIVSSTLLRTCLKDLDFNKFRELSGRNYFIMGEVVRGKAVGRTLGYPTANQKISGRKLPLKKGVYASRTIIAGKAYHSISFVGNSLGNMNEGQFETFIFDFSDDIYGEIVKVEILHFIREQREMKSLEELKEAIDDDIKKAKCLI